MKDPTDSNVRAVERALQIMECFDDEHPERGISDIAQAVGLHKATAHRIVTTLVNYGHLERVEDGQKYRLGLELPNLGYKVLRRMDLRKEAVPFMSSWSRNGMRPATSAYSIRERSFILRLSGEPGLLRFSCEPETARLFRDLCLKIGGELRACQPADILNTLLSISEFEGSELQIDQESLTRAARVYFAKPKGVAEAL